MAKKAEVARTRVAKGGGGSTPRLAKADRRDQMIAAALRLLGDTSIETLTTRALADELGLSQPALFRHFADREALLLAVVEHARASLEEVAVAILADARPAVAQLRALGVGVLEHAARTPGLPRLLFASATPGAGAVRDALAETVSMQGALVAELVREGQRAGELDPALEPEVAATLFVGILQGLVLRWELGGRREPLAARFEALFLLWLRGAATRRPRAARPEASVEPAAIGAREGATLAGAGDDEGAGPSEPLAALDVRPLLASGVDPLMAILERLERLPPAGLLLVEAPFRPAPLLSLLARRGHGVHDERLDERHWLVEVVVGAQPAIEDLRDLEPPEPLERVLTAAAALAPGGVYLARLPRFPRLLVPHLQRRGLGFAVLGRPDGAALVRIEGR